MPDISEIKFHPFKIRTVSDQRFLTAWTIVSFVLSLALTSFFAWKTYLEGYFSGPMMVIGRDGSTANPKAPMIPTWEVFGTDKITFILLGYDEVDKFAHRSDTLMVGSVDFIARKVNILSIPRDTMVRIPRHGWQKINAAYSLGGEDLARKAIEDFTGVQIDYVIAVNYKGFIDVVNALGGVTINIEHDMNYDDRRGNLHIHFKAGEQHLDGQKALEYARYRHDARGDLARIDRQQALINALVDQAIRPENLPNLVPAANAFIENIAVTRNEESVRRVPEIGPTEVLSLLGFIKELNQDQITFYTIPTRGVMYHGLSCQVPDYTEIERILGEIFLDDAPIGWDDVDIIFRPKTEQDERPWLNESTVPDENLNIDGDAD